MLTALRRNARELKGLSPVTAARTLLLYARRRLFLHRQRRRVSFDRKEMSDAQLFDALHGEPASGVPHFKCRQEPIFFIDESVKADLVETVRDEVEGAEGAAVEEADAICRHHFSLLGAEDVCLGTPIDWHRDFVSGFSWNPEEYYGDIVKVDLRTRADIKVPWELSRFQYLLTLGRAAWHVEAQPPAGRAEKGDNENGALPPPGERYAREFVTLVEDWIDRNPPAFGVNWACTMEVAIRAVNWIWGFYFFRDTDLVDDRFVMRFLKSLLEHGRHIYHNLENLRPTTNNHFVSNLVGLVYLGVMFPEFREAQKWLRLGLRGLEAEMERQVFDDGTSYEASIHYHRLALELFSSPFMLCRLNGIAMSERYVAKLEKMFEFVMYYTKPDGTAPQLGDADDGRLHPLSSIHTAIDAQGGAAGCRRFTDHRYTLALGGALFDREDLAAAGGDQREEMLWLCGREYLAAGRRAKRSTLAKPRSESKGFRDGGYFILRSNDMYMVVDCMTHSALAPTVHRHNSRLGVELYCCDRTFLVDPGSYTYTASAQWRNRFRSTPYHNTVVVDSEEMDHFREDRLFSVTVHSRVRIRAWLSEREYDFLDAEHSGYERLGEPVTHRRQIYFDKEVPFWIIADICTGRGEHTFEQFFHFAPIPVTQLHGAASVVPFDEILARDRYGLVDPAALRPGEAAAVSLQAGDNESALAIVPVGTEGVIGTITSGWVSYSYGRKCEAPVARYTLHSACPARLVTVLFPMRRTAP